MSKKPRFPPKPRSVVLVIFPGFQLLDAAGPITAFEIASRFVPDAYDVRVAAERGGVIPSSSGVGMPAGALKGARLSTIDTFVVVGGDGTREAIHNRALIATIARAHRAVRRMTSVCSGALLLAQAGVLDGKRATTHWRRAAQLASDFPNVRVDADCIYIRDGNVWTSAGITAGVDLALALIADDLGEEVATNVAREMVVYAKRPGGQAQHSALLDLGAHAPRFAPLNAWIRENLSGDLSVERLAARAAMSPRNFSRAYTAETGATPAKAVERIRVETARAALEHGASIQEIAARTGFGDPERMRRAFLRMYGAPPAAMRRTLRRA